MSEDWLCSISIFLCFRKEYVFIHRKFSSLNNCGKLKANKLDENPFTISRKGAKDWLGDNVCCASIDSQYTNKESNVVSWVWAEGKLGWGEVRGNQFYKNSELKFRGKLYPLNNLENNRWISDINL